MASAPTIARLLVVELLVHPVVDALGDRAPSDFSVSCERGASEAVRKIKLALLNAIKETTRTHDSAFLPARLEQISQSSDLVWRKFGGGDRVRRWLF